MQKAAGVKVDDETPKVLRELLYPVDVLRMHQVLGDVNGIDRICEIVSQVPEFRDIKVVSSDRTKVKIVKGLQKYMIIFSCLVSEQPHTS